MSTLELVEVPGWPRPRGYANGMITRGPVLRVAGQIGWDPLTMEFPDPSFPGQFKKALLNVLEVVRAAGAEPSDVAELTIFVTDVPAYRSSIRELGGLWRELFGKHYPAMALIGIKELVMPQAMVEIQAVAVLPQKEEG